MKDEMIKEAIKETTNIIDELCESKGSSRFESYTNVMFSEVLRHKLSLIRGQQK